MSPILRELHVSKTTLSFCVIVLIAVNVDDSLKAAAADVESLGAGLVRSASQVSVRSDLQEAAADYDEDYEEEHAVAPNSQAPQPQTVTTSNTSWDEPPSFDSTWASQDQSEATWPQPSPTVWTSQDQGPQSISIDEEPPAPESHTHPHIAQNGSAKPEEAPTERAIAIYPYTAVNDDELTIYESESLELFLEPDDGSGWVRAKNSTGLVGFVPRNYIQTDTSSEVDDDVQRQDSLFKENQDMYSNDISNSYEAEGSFSAVDYTTTPQQAAATTVNHAEGPAMVTDGTYYKALYEYEPVGPGELAFDEGAVIRVISKEGHTGVDDGWWFGEWNGTEGAFPSLLVRECVPTGELVSPTFEEGIEEDLDVVATPAGWAPPPMHAPPSPPTMNSETLSQAVEKKLLKAQAEMVQRDIIVTEPTPEIEERRILDEPPTQEDKEEEPPQDGDRQQELEEEVKAPPAEEVFQEVERVKKVEAEISSKAEGKPVKKAEAEPMKKAEAEPVKIVEAEQVKEVEAEPVKKAEVEPVKIVETEQVKKAEAEPMKKAEAEPMTIVTREKVEPQTPSASPVGDMPSEFMVSASEISAKCREEHLEEEPRPENPTVPPPTLSLPDPATIVVTAPTPVVEEKPLPEEEVDESSPAEFPPPPPPEASVEEDKEDQADAVEGIASVPPPFPEVIEDNVQEAALPPPEPPVAKTEVAKKAPPQLSLESPPEEIEVEKLKQLEHLRESDT
ncbi:unnamed protein product [Cyprideis torosa]|uniref:Uncharacterized protein n=1 Tax=Cyprideis torosa TaxID=163714 RepID=A0A7R8ZQV0_9CRUS|nr:unnamed protein product [Cyprideis torosa]CAG0897272.1 unnamed protein product [Cyprideis torosa]